MEIRFAIVRSLRRIPKGTCAITVGAREGDSVAELLPRGAHRRVVAFELCPERCEGLRRRFRRAPFVEVVNAALAGSSPGEIVFYRRPHGQRSGLLRTVTPVVTLDDWCRERGLSNVGLLAVETARFALEVVRGATGLLSGGRIALVTLRMESPVSSLAPVTPSEIDSLMFSNGYLRTEEEPPASIRGRSPAGSRIAYRPRFLATAERG